MIKTVWPVPVLLLEEWHDPPCMKGKDQAIVNVVNLHMLYLSRMAAKTHSLEFLYNNKRIFLWALTN